MQFGTYESILYRGQTTYIEDFSDGERLFLIFWSNEFYPLTLKLANQGVGGTRGSWPDVTPSTWKARSLQNHWFRQMNAQLLCSRQLAGVEEEG